MVEGCAATLPEGDYPTMEAATEAIETVAGEMDRAQIEFFSLDMVQYLLERGALRNWRHGVRPVSGPAAPERETTGRVRAISASMHSEEDCCGRCSTVGLIRRSRRADVCVPLILTPAWIQGRPAPPPRRTSTARWHRCWPGALDSPLRPPPQGRKLDLSRPIRDAGAGLVPGKRRKATLAEGAGRAGRCRQKKDAVVPVRKQILRRLDRCGGEVGRRSVTLPGEHPQTRGRARWCRLRPITRTIPPAVEERQWGGNPNDTSSSPTGGKRIHRTLAAG